MTRLVIASMLCCFSMFLHGQDSIVYGLKKHLATFDSLLCQEKLYLQTDRTLYSNQSTIWFSIVLTDASNRLSTISRDVYVELISPKGAVIQTQTLENLTGKVHGDFFLDKGCSGGIYKIRAYSYWMRNFPEEYYFEKEVQVQKVLLPNVLMKLDFERASYGAGSLVTASFEAKTKENDPLLRHTIHFDVFVKGKVWKTDSARTDAKGEAVLNFDLPQDLDSRDVLLLVKLQHEGQNESISRMVPIPNKDLDVQLLPEGGHLVADFKNRMAYRIVNSEGKPVDVTAQLLDANLNPILTTKSYHQGMGSFDFLPQNQQAYYFKIIEPKGIDKVWKLPEVATNKLGLHLKKQSPQSLEVEVYAPEKQSINLLLQQQGKVVYEKTFLAESGRNSIIISTQNMSVGITQMTVFDALGRPHGERLVFVNKHRQLSVDIQTNKEQYQPREAVEMTLQVQDETGKGVAGDFTLAVVDDGQYTFMDDKQDNVLSYLLMSSDLKGKVFEPSFYFKPNEPKADTALDYVMLTHGWRRFNWDKMLSENTELWLDSIRFDRSSDEISGYLKVNDVLYDNKRIFLLQKKKRVKPKKALMTAQTNKNGFFRFKKKGLSFPVYLAVQHQRTTHFVRVDKYSKSGLKLLRESDAIPYLAELPWEEKKGRSSLTIRSSHNPNSAVVQGKVIDIFYEEGLPFANVVVEKDGVQIMGTQTDFDGNYQVTLDRSGLYDIVVSYVGFPTVKTQGIPFKQGQVVRFDVEMDEGIDVSATKDNNKPPSGYLLVDTKRQKVYEGKISKEADLPQLSSWTLESTSTEGIYAEVETLTPARFSPSELAFIEASNTAGGKYSEMIVRAYRIPLIDQSNTSGGQILTSADIIPGGGWGAPSSSYNYSWSSRDYDDVYLTQVGAVLNYSTAKTFYCPKYDITDTIAQRSDFRKTIYWNPSVKTDENGIATLSYYNSDETTTFRAIVEGVGAGNIGRTEHTYSVELPFSLSATIPKTLTYGDTVQVPIVLRNATTQAIEGTLNIEQPSCFDLLEELTDKVVVPALDVKILYASYRVKNRSSQDTFKVNFIGSGIKDGIAEPVTVIAKGFRHTFSMSGQKIEQLDTFELDTFYPNSLEVNFTVYTNLLGQMMDAVQGLLREPYGCFEQTSSCNYPNVLALQLMKSNGKTNPKIEKRALAFLKKGYQKLKGFETDLGGFDWYGKTPPHEGLTAYGLVQLYDMQQVYPVETAWIQRIQNFLLSRKDGKGGFLKYKSYSFAAQNNAVYNAYITWALSEVGESAIQLELDSATQEALKSQDCYRMSLMALANYNVGNTTQAEALVDLIANYIQTVGLDSVKSETTLTNSWRRSKRIETLALACLALMKSKAANDEQILAIIRYLQGQRHYRYYGSTQGTILVLKAFCEFQKRSISIEGGGTVTLYINDVLVKQEDYQLKQGKNPSFSSIGKYCKKGTNTVRVQFTNTQKSLPYSLDVRWHEIKPESSQDCPVEVATQLAHSEVIAGDLVRMEVQVDNKKFIALPNPMAVVGIPAGLNVQAWQLKELQEQGLFDFYELKNNQLVLYFRGLKPRERKTINFDLTVDVPGSYTAPASSAYLYYMNEHKYWIAGEKIKIKP